VRIKDRRWRPALRVLALAVAIAAAPLLCVAEESGPPAAKPGIQASMQKIAATTTLTKSPVKAARAQDSPGTAGKGSFFKTPAGIVVLGILAGGTAYALYSVRQDRIHSVIRQGQ